MVAKDAKIVAKDAVRVESAVKGLVAALSTTDWTWWR